MTCQAYLEQFTNSKDIVEHCGRNIGTHPRMIAKALEDMGTDTVNATNMQMTTTTETTKETYLALAFIMNLDHTRYVGLLVELENNFLKESNEYPWTMTAAYNLLMNWKQDPGNVLNLTSGDSTCVAFMNVNASNDDDDWGGCVPDLGDAVPYWAVTFWMMEIPCFSIDHKLL